jgi:RNA 3'-terminal phosphate cyclase
VTTTWTFAIDIEGRLNIWTHGGFPPGENIVELHVNQKAGMFVVDRDKLEPLRQLLGSPEIREVVRHTGPAVADELEDALTRITLDLQGRIDRLRGEDGPGYKG